MVHFPIFVTGMSLANIKIKRKLKEVTALTVIFHCRRTLHSYPLLLFFEDGVFSKKTRNCSFFCQKTSYQALLQIRNSHVDM